MVKTCYTCEHRDDLRCKIYLGRCHWKPQSKKGGKMFKICATHKAWKENDSAAWGRPTKEQAIRLCASLLEGGYKNIVVKEYVQVGSDLCYSPPKEAVGTLKPCK